MNSLPNYELLGEIQKKGGGSLPDTRCQEESHSISREVLHPMVGCKSTILIVRMGFSLAGIDLIVGCILGGGVHSNMRKYLPLLDAFLSCFSCYRAPAL